MALLEKWHQSLDQGLFSGALLTDLSKAFGCLPHDLLIVKLCAYGLDIKAIRFIFDYLTNRKQRTKIENEYSTWSELLLGVPQGSILGPLLFNIFICDLFLSMENFDIASYADDNTPYFSGVNIDIVVESLGKASEIISKWLSDNQMKGNVETFHVLLSANEIVHVNIGTARISSSSCEKLLGINIDSKLKMFAKELAQR